MIDAEQASEPRGIEELDVLIVGAGPTGLTLAAQLRTFGTRFRLIDRALDRANESRALAVQARSLEILQSLGLGDALVARGNTAARVTIHVDGRVVAQTRLTDFAAPDTRFPYILFVSQVETEALLADHLSSHGVAIERGVELVDFAQHPSGVKCALRHVDGREEQVRARYLAGCDGAHSLVRKRCDIRFEGEPYLQDFMLGDVEADAQQPEELQSNSIHPFAGRHTIALFFPLGHPTTWRVVAMSASGALRRIEPDGEDRPIAGDLSLAELQAVVQGATGGSVRVRDPAWLTHFRLHHRQAARYRKGRAFLAGDAGHIHSPVGAQGMNTGIQDAWNLGWKLALVARGSADPRLLDSYEAERWLVGRTLLRFTDRVFSILVRSLSAGAFGSWLRRTILGRIVPAILRSNRLRTSAFRFISELDIRYRRSPAIMEGEPRSRAGPRAGDRLPDARMMRAGRIAYLHELVAGPHFHLLLCGPPGAWDRSQVNQITGAHAGLVTVHYFANSDDSSPSADDSAGAMRLLGTTDTAQVLVRPDGYIAFRCAGRDLNGLRDYLRSWLTVSSA